MPDERPDAFGEAFAASGSAHVYSWWNSAFRVGRSLGDNFSLFLRSFHRRPASSWEVRSTGVIFPMPLPYPEMFLSASDRIGSGDTVDASNKVGVNLIIAALNIFCI